PSPSLVPYTLSLHDALPIYSEYRNSKNKGASVIWQHRFSDIDMIQASVQQSEVKFDEMPQNDYEYQNAMLAYSATLRAFSYILQDRKSTRLNSSHVKISYAV